MEHQSAAVHSQKKGFKEVLHLPNKFLGGIFKGSGRRGRTFKSSNLEYFEGSSKALAEETSWFYLEFFLRLYSQ